MYISRYIPVIIAITVFSACKRSLIVEIDKSIVTADQAFSSNATATSAVTGMYSLMAQYSSYAGGAQGIGFLCALASDEMDFFTPPGEIPMAGYYQFFTNDIIPNNAILGDVWGSVYKTIYQANAILKELENNTKIGADVRQQLMGETHFMRAFCHFYLVNLFGDVPLVLTADYRVNEKASRTPSAQVYGQIVADLLTAKGELSEAYAGPLNTIDRVRPNKFTATALLARVYLYLHEWEKAEQQATEILDNVAMYDLESDLALAFLIETKEAIWQIYPVGPTETRTPEANVYIIRDEPEYAMMPQRMRDAFEPGDVRRTAWVNSYTQGSITWYFPYKYKQSYAVGEPRKEYSIIFRVAEQFLIRAEARAMQNKLTGTNSAASDINKIRNRASLGNTSATTQAQLLTAIEQERRVELFTEWGHRWFDLKRWKRSTAVLGPIKSKWSDNDTLCPLPYTEMLKAPNLRPQNAGY